jgi:hypothetical protein
MPLHFCRQKQIGTSKMQRSIDAATQQACSNRPAPQSGEWNGQSQGALMIFCLRFLEPQLLN